MSKKAVCKCQYYTINKGGQLVCSVCGKPPPEKPKIEDKIKHGHETKKAPLYVSDKDKAEAKAKAEALGEA